MTDDTDWSSRNRKTNATDYDFPPMWGTMSDEQKSQWMTRRRVYRQAIRQDTAFGRRHSHVVSEAKRTDTDGFRFDGDGD